MTYGTVINLPPVNLYPEREDRQSNWQIRFEDLVASLPNPITSSKDRMRRQRIVRQVNEWRDQLGKFDDFALDAFVENLREQLLRKKRLRQIPEFLVVKSFAVIREVATRTINHTHYDVQLEGGCVLLEGAIAELETGEGKTLTATLAAATAALAGIPVHVITVNDYLANRDAELMRPLYERLGLSVGVVTAGMAKDERRRAYGCQIAYCTNKEIAFDYLRDRIALGYSHNNVRTKLACLRQQSEQPVLRGLHFAIVDEADSILIDEARTPLIISGRSDPELERLRAEQAFWLIEELREVSHFDIKADSGEIRLTDTAKSLLHERAEHLGGAWRGAIFREEYARNAIGALNLFQRDEHYLVRDDKIEIIDENTGRVMPDRSWGDGLHQLIEVKEGCTVTGQTMPIARMTFQRFFRRYERLAGMTGTGNEARSELASVYRLAVTRMDTNKPLARCYAPQEIFRYEQEKWAYIVSRIKALKEVGSPVLLGTRTVAASEHASKLLAEAGIEHEVLNAAQDAREAEIIAEAGGAGRTTVATNMAGRGVDIQIDRESEQKGGLHVIMSEMHDSSRIDRQLFGRCARQGQAGRVEVVLSMEDPLITGGSFGAMNVDGGLWIRRLVFRRAQKLIEQRHARARRELVRWDEKVGAALAFSGRME